MRYCNDTKSITWYHFFFNPCKCKCVFSIAFSLSMGSLLYILLLFFYHYYHYYSCTIEVLEWISNFIPHFKRHDYLSTLGLKLFHVSKKGCKKSYGHYTDVVMGAMASQITSITVVYSRSRSKKTSKLCFTGLCAGNSLGTGEFPAQRASNAENVSILVAMPQHPDSTGISLCLF